VKIRSLIGFRTLAVVTLVAGIAAAGLWFRFSHSMKTKDIETGKRFYDSSCIACHGPDGDGVSGVDFGHGQFRHATSDGDLVRTIVNGVPGALMGPQPFSEEQAQTIVRYLRDMSRMSATGRTSNAGEVSRGKAVFEGKGQCLKCHSVDSENAVGIDLSAIGSMRRSIELENALVQPNARPGSRLYRAVTAEGKTIQGRLFNQNTFSVELLDTKERLVSLSKANLREYGFVTSAMPSYKDKLDSQELADVVSYLKSLKGFNAPSASAVETGVSFENILKADQEPDNWLTYSGSLSGQRYSNLAQITPENVKNVELQWIYQTNTSEKFEATPLVINGIMYVVRPPNDVVALDAATGRIFWVYSYPRSGEGHATYPVNRGLAVLGNELFMATKDAHLIAINAKTGELIWDVVVAKPEDGYGFTLAPLVVKDKVIVGPAGGEYGIRGFLAAFNAHTGKEIWRFNLIPGPGEPGHETWSGDSWKHGGASVWMTGTYDADLNLTYWGIGNPGPDWNGDVRPGDNLYTDSVVALNPDNGQLKWHFQFTPHDEFDFDSVQVPVLADMQWEGMPRKVLLTANRNGFWYVLDRTTGHFLYGKPFVKVTWTSGLDQNGRPQNVVKSSTDGVVVYPGIQGGTSWYSPSYSPRTGLFYVPAWEDTYTTVIKRSVERAEDGIVTRWFGPIFEKVTHRPFSASLKVQGYFGGTLKSPPIARSQQPIFDRPEEDGYGVIRAFDPHSGDLKWQFKMMDVTDSGILTTASDLLFSGGRDGYFFALDARTGSPLWKAAVGGWVTASPIAYSAAGKEYVAVAAGNSLFTYALKQ
jgi:alcohol dehydrogenase (cytochrome c)